MALPWFHIYRLAPLRSQDYGQDTMESGEWPLRACNFWRPGDGL